MLDGFPKNTQYQISRKSVQWEPSCSMRRDGQTERRNEAYSQSIFTNWRTRLKIQRPAQRVNLCVV